MIGLVFEGRYTINGFLAEGPVFTLYSARDKLTSRDVSLRLVKAPFDGEARFKTALAAAIDRTQAIRVPTVERLTDLESDDGKVYLLGELTRAPSLADRIRKLAPFTAPVAVAFAISIARGLDAFHKMGLAHGDISGENIAVLGDGETRLQLGGVWEAYSASNSAGVMVLPTLAPYLAPEVSNGEQPSASSDLYAVGILLFELLTARRPYQAETGLATAMRHANEPTPRVKNLNPSIPAVLDEIVYKAMSKSPQERYRNASELIFDLRQTQDALRFGRTLNWPISPSPNQPATRKVQVAPRMGAIRDPEPEPERRKRDKPERDVPIWLLLVFALAAVVAIGMVMVIFLIGANRPVLKQVPNLAGLSLTEARAVLAPMHFKANVGNSVPSSRYEADKVVSTDPPYGKNLAENSTISLNLSLGANQVTVPNLKSLTPDKAREELSTVNLALDDQIAKVNDTTVPAGTICKQDPPAGKKLVRAGKVHVSISDLSAPTAAETAEAKGKHFGYNIDGVLPNLSKSVELRIDMIDASGTKTVFEGTKRGGESFSANPSGIGDQATFVVYYDGQEVDRQVKHSDDSDQ